mgnify:CR=1 FL=1
MRKSEGLSIIALILISILILVGVGYAANWGWNKISEVAAKQSGRDLIPKVTNLENLLNEKVSKT